MLRLLRRVLVTVIVTMAVIFLGVTWVGPVALSFYAEKKAPPIARIIPASLWDTSVSAAAGERLSYAGYDFEVPWSDLDESQTKLYPKEKPDKTRAVLTFRSGLVIKIAAIPPREWATSLPKDFKVSPHALESIFGRDIMNSDYRFVKILYEFTPDKMHHWTFSPFSHAVINSDEFLLLVKSMALLKPAETGIFYVGNQEYEGFQQGNPQIRQDWIALNLYSEQGSAEIIFLQDRLRNRTGVTQPEINRVIQSLHKTTATVKPVS